MSGTVALIFGAGGLLGRHLAALGRSRGLATHAFRHAEAPIEEHGRVASLLAGVLAAAPAGARLIILNAAAATDVDRCERDLAYARAGNHEGPRVLAETARALGARLLHVSTDYVFSGMKGSPYEEHDPPDPVSVYGRTKLEGERAVLASGADVLICRVAWLYGAGGGNFLARLPRLLLKGKGKLEAIADQWSSPTYVVDAAPVLLDLALTGPRGRVLHVTNEGGCSYFEAAQAAARALGHDPDGVRAIPAAGRPRPARRPRDSRLAAKGLHALGLTPLRPWKEAYSEFARAEAEQ